MTTDTESKLATERKPDDPMVINSEYRFTSQDRRKIDRQILALQKFVAEGLINSIIGTYFRVDPDLPEGLKKGDVVCEALRGRDRVVLADSENLARTGAATGIVMANAAPGAPVFVAACGHIPRAVTGLDTNNPGMVRVSSAGRCERVDSIGENDARVGYVNLTGTLQLDFRGASGAGGGGGSGGGVQLGTDPPVNVNAAAAYVGDSDFAAPLDHKHGVDIGIPVDVGGENSAGSGTDLALANHVHAHGEHSDGSYHDVVDEDDAGFAPALDGAEVNSVLTKTATGIVEWAQLSVVPPDSETGTFPSDDDPLPDANPGQEGPGTGVTWSRWDHQHPEKIYIVQELEDLPVDVGGERELATDAPWLFLNTIAIGSSTLVIPDGATVLAGPGGVSGSANPIVEVGAGDRADFYVERTGGSGDAVVCAGTSYTFRNWTVLGKMRFEGGGSLDIFSGYVAQLDILDGTSVSIVGTKMHQVQLLGDITGNLQMHGVLQRSFSAPDEGPLLEVANGVSLSGDITMVGCVAAGSNKLLVLGDDIASGTAAGGVHVHGCTSPNQGGITLTGPGPGLGVVPNGGLNIIGCKLHWFSPYTGFNHLTDGVRVRACFGSNGEDNFPVPETPNGHIIRNDGGSSFAQRHRLRVVGASVADDAANNETVITPGAPDLPLWGMLWRTSTSGTDPGGGNIKANSALFSTTTQLQVSEAIAETVVRKRLRELSPGQRIRVTRKSSKQWDYDFEVTAATNMGDYVRLDVVPVYEWSVIDAYPFADLEPVWVMPSHSRSLGLRGGTMDEHAAVFIPKGSIEGLRWLGLDSSDGWGVIDHQSAQNIDSMPSSDSRGWYFYSSPWGLRIHHAPSTVGGGRNITEVARRMPTLGTGSWAVRNGCSSGIRQLASGTQSLITLSYASSSVGPFDYNPGGWTGPLTVFGTIWIATVINAGTSVGGGWSAKYVVRWGARNTAPAFWIDSSGGDGFNFGAWSPGLSASGPGVALQVTVPGGLTGKLYYEMMGSIIAAPLS